MPTSVTQYFHAPPDKYQNSDMYITWAGHRLCDASHNVGPRVMDSYKLVFCINGKGYIEYGNENATPVSKGDMMVIFPKQRHHYYANPEEPWELMWVCINGKYCAELLADVGITREQHIIHNALTPAIQRTMLTIINALGYTEDSLRLAATGHLYVLFSYLMQTTKKQKKISDQYRQNAAVFKAIRFIEENYHLNFDVNMLCRHVNYSRSYLSRIFKAETNMTIPEYANNIRIQHAKTLLADTKIPLREVATSVGISDPFYFSKIFKSIAGQSPSSYRNKHAQPVAENDNPEIKTNK